MNKTISEAVIKIMKLLGCEFSNESWYDEEGVEGTRIYLPNNKEIKVYGWGEDIDVEDIIDELEKLCQIKQ